MRIEHKGHTYEVTREGLHYTLSLMDCEMRDAISQLPYGTKRDQFAVNAMEERYMEQSEFLKAAIEALPWEEK